MTSAAEADESSRACATCSRRGWLLSRLSGPLDYQCRDRGRLIELLALNDEDLIRAVGGSRRAELEAAHARFGPKDVPQVRGVAGVCRHDPSYPSALRGAHGPPMVNVAGGVERLRALVAGPIAAIVGSSRATDYGMEVAKSLARGLAASGVTVTSGLSDGIAVAALVGAIEVEGKTVAVLPGGVDVACPAKRRALYGRVMQRGCALTELPCGSRPRRWTAAAAERILAGLACLTIVVEAGSDARELSCARIAQTLGRPVAAIPGRVTSPASSGPHALLMSGAHLVRGPADALELLCGPGAPPICNPTAARARLRPTLRDALDRVGAGEDTPDKLEHGGSDSGALLLALSELELMGLLARGDGGRYVPRYPRPTDEAPADRQR